MPRAAGSGPPHSSRWCMCRKNRQHMLLPYYEHESVTRGGVPEQSRCEQSVSGALPRSVPFWPLV